MHVEGDFSQGNLERWETVHPKDLHDLEYISNGMGQIIIICHLCDVFQGFNEIEAGLPIVERGVADESPQL